jgi:hypothetical protein
MNRPPNDPIDPVGKFDKKAVIEHVFQPPGSPLIGSAGVQKIP